MARAATNRLGSELGKFEIIERLGAGGMGSVYLAYDPELNRRLAVKVLGSDSRSIEPGSTFNLAEISPELIEKPRTEVMSHRQPVSSLQSGDLLAEARAMAQLSHPNVVSIYDIGSSEGQLFIAMELVEGDNLREWLERSPRSRGEILDAFRQAASGLAAAHRAGLIHRDFKPDNVLIDAEGVVRVADFGLALDEAHRTQRMAGVNKQLAGTPGYIAPEVLIGGTPTPQSDVFAFCVALAEALGGARPIARLDLSAARSLVRGLGRLPSKLRDGLARGLCADPTLRPKDGAGLVAMMAKKRALRAAFAAVALAASIGGAAIAFAATPSEQQSACDAPWERLEASWNADRSVAIRERIASLGGPGATARAAEVIGNLERGADRLRATHRDVCLANERGEIDDGEATARNRCVDEAVSAFDALLDALSLSALDDDIDRLAELASPEKYNTTLCTADRETTEPLAAEASALHREWKRLKVEKSLGNRTLEQEYAAILGFLARPEASADKRLHAEILYAKAENEFYLSKSTVVESLRAAASAAANGVHPHLEVQTTLNLVDLALTDERLDEASTLLPLVAPKVPTLNSAELRARYHRVHGRFLHRQRKTPQAIVEYQRSLAELKTVIEQPHDLRKFTYQELSSMLAGAERIDEGLEVRNELLALELATHGPDHHHVLETQVIVGALEVRLRRVDDGIATIDTAIDAMAALEQTPSVVVALRAARANKADTLYSLGRYTEARKNYVALIAAAPPASSEHLRLLRDAFHCSNALNEGETAEKYAREIVDVFTKRHGEAHRSVADGWVLLSRALAIQEKFEQALSALEKGRTLRLELFGPRHRATISIDNEIARLELKRKNYAAAEPLLRDLIARTSADPAVPPHATAYDRSRLATCLLELGRVDEALEQARQAQEALESPRADAGFRSWNRFQLARALHASGERKAGREMAERARKDLASGTSHAQESAKKVSKWLKEHPL